ncbi:hypothetical protein T484DRAFT_1765459 [Baffinella frigidus]|nr:hypothetical protein T484DRAFT_1765459 [Cryptophyta sp. CCMP2293]
MNPASLTQEHEHAAYAGLKGKIAAIAAPQPPFFAPPACEFLGHLGLLLFGKPGGHLGLLLFGKPDVTIFYTLDGSEPTADNYAACGGSPLSIDLLSNTRVTARCIDAEGISGPTDTHAYAFTGATQSSRGGGRREAGLGMLLERSHGSEETTIKGLVEGGAADIDGRIQVGDTILRLGGREVRTISLRGLETLCAGKEGSQAHMVLRRAEREGSQAQMVLRRAPNNVRNGLEQVNWKP